MVMSWAFSLFFCLGMGEGFLFPGKPVLIADPKPTHIEKNFLTLEVVAQVGPEIDKEHFFARPWQLKVNSKGNIFVIDNLLDKIFIFDAHLKLVKVFGNAGRGPGEMSKHLTAVAKNIYIGPDDKLYISDPGNKKLLVFDAGGNHLTDIRIPFEKSLAYFPVVDKKNNFYRISREKGGAVDIMDSQLNIVNTLLSNSEYERFIVRIPALDNPRKYKNYTFKETEIYHWCQPSFTNTYYDLFTEDGLLIYLTNPSTAFVFKKNRLVKRFDLRPRDALKNYRYVINRLTKKLNKENIGPTIFKFLVIDRDEPKYFYLRGPSDEQHRPYLYKFNLEGDLIAVYSFALKKAWILEKKNNFFYGLDSDGYVYLLKEKNKTRGEK
jgi:hypothetical protein